MLNNKHVIIALIVAPILAIISYFAIDRMVGEQPQLAKPGASYPLMATPNCRYPSGKCDFKNGNFNAELTVKPLPGNGLVLSVVSHFPLLGVKVSFGNKEEMPTPSNMRMADSEGKAWQLETQGNVSAETTIRLVIAAGESLYFGETKAGFVDYDTSYEKDFRRSP